MSEPVERIIDRLIGNLEALRNEIRHAENILCDQRRRIDNWPTGNDNPKVTGGDPTSRPEAATLARDTIDQRLRSHREELDAATLIIRNLRRDCQADARREGDAFTVNPPPAPCCNAIGRDGAELSWPGEGWADHGCTEIPSRGPLCDRCSKREFRWRLKVGLPPRRDGVYAGDLDDRYSA